MFQRLTILITSSLIVTSSVGAQPSAPSDPTLLEAIEHQLFDDPSISHHEYTGCVTHAVNACPRDIQGRDVSLDHGPSLPETLDWIGHQLKTAGLAHFFDYEGCTIAIDLMDGIPEWQSWSEKIDGKLVQKGRSILNSTMQAGVSAELLASNGHAAYMHPDHRTMGSADSPKRIVFANDAGVLELSQLLEIKNYIGTYENGELRAVYPDYTGEIKLKFLSGAYNKHYYTGTGFSESDAPLRDRLEQGLGEPPNSKQMYTADYALFDTEEPHSAFFLSHNPAAIELNIKLTKAFLHAMNLCNKPKSSSP